MSNVIYFDNAATTQLDREVLESMLPYLIESYGNPSSTYSIGRSARMAIEGARRSVAQLLGVKPNTIYFTSGGSESNNNAIVAAVRDLGCTYMITSPIEHHAVLHTLEHYSADRNIDYSLVALTGSGEVDYNDLEQQVEQQTKIGHRCLVSLMHANNETGALLDLERVADICERSNAIFHSDCVQTIGHFPLNLSDTRVHMVSGAGHKFHGPKGTGILYVREDMRIKPLIFGGGQERNMRAGTENVAGIVGFARALEKAMAGYEVESRYIIQLRNYMKGLLAMLPGVTFHTPDTSLYTILSVCFPRSERSAALILELDMAGICVSGGSACSSEAGDGSHVIRALKKNAACTTIRFSFSKYNTMEEVGTVFKVLRTILAVSVIAFN